MGWAQSAEPLIMPVSDVPPFTFQDESGTYTGFMVDLAQMIGEEIGVPIEFLEVSGGREFIEAQATGRTQMIAGVIALPELADTNVISDTVSTESLLPAILVNPTSPNTITSSDITGQRIAVVPPTTGSNDPILQHNEAVQFDTPQAAIMSLLSGRVDAALLSSPVMYQVARQAGIDHRIELVGPPLRDTTRHVALHESRANLLAPVNEAIARIEADGRLEALRTAYAITAPAPPPDVLRIGITHLPPLFVVSENAEPTGLNVDVTRALTERAGIDIEFVPLPLSDWVQGPAANGLDAVSGLVIAQERLSEMDFSYPILDRGVSVVLDAQIAADTIDIDSLRGQRVGVIEESIFDIIIARYDALTPVYYSSYDEMFAAQVEGSIDAAISAPDVAEETIARIGAEDDLVIAAINDLTIETGIALRPGLGALRERLNAVTPGFLLTDTYEQILDQYFGEQVFWTQDRVRLLLFGVGVSITLSLATFLFQRQRQRRREYERQAQHNAALQKLVRELEAANREQAEFTYAISHDLKAPTNTMALLLDELSLEQGATDEGGQIIGDMRMTNGRMSRLITDILDYSKIVDGEFSVEAVNLNDIVDDVISDLAAQIKQSKATVTRDELPVIQGNPSQLRILFQNLISNGIKFCHESRRPNVEISHKSGVLLIEDNGIGIPEDKQDSVFGLFKRLHLTTEYEGTGLGLAICRRVMANHLGEILCRSSLGNGTVFELKFDGKTT